MLGQYTAAGTSVAGSKAYDPWGTVTATTGTVSGLLGFQSGWADAAAGKTLMGARWYDPAAGDFTSADTVQVSPVPDPAAGSPFAYAADSPLDRTDPTGHMPLNPDGTQDRTAVKAAAAAYRASVARAAPRPVLDAHQLHLAHLAHLGQTVTAAAAKPAARAPRPAPAACYYICGVPASFWAGVKVSAGPGCYNCTTQTARKAAVPLKPKDKPAPAAGRPEQRGAAYAPGCSGRLLQLGACPSEAGLAGTTPAQVKQSLIGAAWVLSSAVPVGDILDLLGIAGRAAAGPAGRVLSRILAPKAIAYARTAAEETTGLLVSRHSK